MTCSACSPDERSAGARRARPAPLALLLAGALAGCGAHRGAELYRGASLALVRPPAEAAPAVGPGDAVVLRLHVERPGRLGDPDTAEGVYLELDPAALREGAELALPAGARRALAWTVRKDGVRAAEDVEGTLAIAAVAGGEVRGALRLRSAALGLALAEDDVRFQAGPVPRAAPDAPVPPSARQLLVVISDGWTAAEALAWRFDRDPGGPWRPAGRPMRATLGRSGMGWGLGLHRDPPPPGPQKRDGDGRSPAGAFVLDGTFGDGTVPAPEDRPFLLARPETVCVQDPASPDYGRVTREDPKRPARGVERLLRDDGLYRIGVVVHANPLRVAGRGACVFLHVWRRPHEPTAGSTAFGPADAEALIPALEPGAILVQLPRDAYEAVAPAWGLPDLGW